MDERPRQDSDKQEIGLGSFLRKLYRPGPLVLFFVLAIGGLLALGYHLATERTPPPAVVPALVPKVAAAPKIFEEDTSATLEDKVKEVDLAIIEAMRRYRLNLADLELLDVELRHREDRNYHYQVLRLPELGDVRGFLTVLRERLTEREPEALLSDNGTAEALVSIDGVPTHRLLLKTVPFVLSRPEREGPRLAIVIDDIGENLHVLEGLVGLDFPVTLAVWPHASHTAESVALVRRTGHDLLVHFPMEPLGYPRYNPGDDALFTSMSDAEIRARVAENLAQVPGAVGVNNHMGSRFTEDAPGMREALADFRRRGLFFLDSMTTGRSVGRGVAREVGIPFYERDIFLDNVRDVNAIVLQLRKAENVARRQGQAIAIGHPYPATLAALREWDAQRSAAVALVPLSQLPPE